MAAATPFVRQSVTLRWVLWAVVIAPGVVVGCWVRLCACGGMRCITDRIQAPPPQVPPTPSPPCPPSGPLPPLPQVPLTLSEVITPDSETILIGEGMPLPHQPRERGNMVGELEGQGRTRDQSREIPIAVRSRTQPYADVCTDSALGLGSRVRIPSSHRTDPHPRRANPRHAISHSQIVRYNLEFPKTLSPEQRQAVKAALQPQQQSPYNSGPQVRL